MMNLPQPGQQPDPSGTGGVPPPGMGGMMPPPGMEGMMPPPGMGGMMPPPGMEGMMPPPGMGGMPPGMPNMEEMEKMLSNLDVDKLKEMVPQFGEMMGQIQKANQEKK